MRHKLMMIYTFIHLLLAGSVYAQAARTDSSLIGNLLSGEYDLFYSTDAIDKKLKQILKNTMNWDLTLVNPDEVYNVTDVVIQGLPDKRLILGGKSSASVDFFIYESRPGRGNVCLIYQRNAKNKFRIAALRLDDDINSFERLRKAIVDKDYEVIE